MPSLAPRLALAAALALVLAAPGVRAEGLRISESFSMLHYDTVGSAGSNLLVASTSARVSRGRAGLSFGVPLIRTDGRIMVGEEHYVLMSGTSDKPQTGLGDMSVGLDYNLVQNRQKMFILTVGGTMRFNTAAAGLGNGELVGTLGLSAVYGITRQLLAFAEARQGWRGVLTPVRSVLRVGDVGAVYWLTDKFGLNAGLNVAQYGLTDKVAPPLVMEMNLGVNFEVLPGLMLNAGGIGGLTSGSPTAGGTFGFGFEL